MNTVEEHHSIRKVEGHDGSVELPDYERYTKTKKFCIIGLALAWVRVACCISVSVYIILTDGQNSLARAYKNSDGKHTLVREVKITDAVAEALAFLVNILVTLLTDTMGFIHSTSLRWAWYREERLEFNTNIRLFTSARKSAVNRWHANAIWTACLILCYASTSQVLVADGSGAFGYSNLYGLAVGVLAIGLLGQAVIATWSAFSLHQIATWSSNPLKNALALRHHELAHVPGRSMMAVSGKNDASVAKGPRHHQKRLYRSIMAIRYIVALVWALPVMAIAWAIALTLISWKSHPDSRVMASSWASNPYEPGALYTSTPADADIPLVLGPNPWPASPRPMRFPVELLLGILVVCAIQGPQTMRLHCIELVVYMTRDEESWRAANRSSKPARKGAHLNTNAFISAVTSWPNIVLFVEKSLLHWVLGQSLLPTFWFQQGNRAFVLYMVYIRVYIFASTTFCLALFTTYLVFRRPGGCQPATWGHFQTLSNLIDDWNVGEKGDLYWGDKGVRSKGYGMLVQVGLWKASGQFGRILFMLRFQGNIYSIYKEY
ncbi:hypothetical protein LCER1_G002584 [Lachnellula cervina]|uniref:Uncharacterized protein n=1 Tax=Lachnellula cervina TaxID=1316786 RepID=A0A7D8YWN7_9HELO|nr:hypothetical protein LCER1_G002584 [Lachnellula cervina]